VTGGSASWIDGRLGNTIPGADLYMLNPAGLIFGPNASLDLSGSFHVSTADYLRLGENDRFYSTPHANDLLALAAPSAFGFLDNDVSPITIEGRGEITEQEWEKNPAGLHVFRRENHIPCRRKHRNKKSTSVISQKRDGYGPVFVDDAGNRVIADEAGNPMPVDENGNYDPEGSFILLIDPDGNFMLGNLDEIASLHSVTEARNAGDVKAPQGRINIAGVASAGEVIPKDGGLEITSPEKGRITLSETFADVSGEGAGSVFIRGGQFLARDSKIHAETMGDQDGGIIDIQADTASFADGLVLSSTTQGKGKGADIRIRAEEPGMREIF